MLLSLTNSNSNFSLNLHSTSYLSAHISFNSGLSLFSHTGSGVRIYGIKGSKVIITIRTLEALQYGLVADDTFTKLNSLNNISLFLLVLSTGY